MFHPQLKSRYKDIHTERDRGSVWLEWEIAYYTCLSSNQPEHSIYVDLTNEHR